MRTTLTSILVVLSFGAFAQTKQTANNIKTAAPGYSGSLAGVEGSSLSMARADHAHPGAVINVMAPPYNASNSGTDATAAVAAAAAALPNGTGTLEFPCGTFKLNFTTTKAVSIRGCGSGNVNTGIAGTLLIAQDTSKPILQWGDGAATTARGFSVRDIMILGDTAAANEDAIYLFAARDVVIDSVAISSPGRDGIRIQCNTFSSSGIHINNSAISGARNHGVHVESCALPGFTSDVTMDGDHINGYTAANSRSLFLDSSTMYITNTYIDTGSVAGTGYIEEKATLSSPRIIQAGMTVDNPNAATTSLDVSSWLSSGGRLGSAISGSGNFNGNVIYSDTTITVNTSTAGHFYQPRFVNAQSFNSLCFPLDETDEGTCNVKLSRVNATGGNTEALVVGGGALRITGTVTFPLQFTGGAAWRNATSGGLRYRKDSNNPSGDAQGVPISPVRTAPTYGAGITIDTNLGTDFFITATNGTAFSIGNPANCSTASCAAGRITITIINASGGALGAVTWGANYDVACWTPPDNGYSRSLTFETDGANRWTQVADGGQSALTGGSAANVGAIFKGCGTGSGVTSKGGDVGAAGSGANGYGLDATGGTATGGGIPGPAINANGGTGAGGGAPGLVVKAGASNGTNVLAAQAISAQGTDATGNAAGTTGGVGGPLLLGTAGKGGPTATGTGGTGGEAVNVTGGNGGAASGAGTGGDGGRGGVMVGGTGGTSGSGTGGTGGNGLGTSGGQGSNNGGGGDGLVSAGGTGNGSGPNGDGVSASSGSGGTGTSRGYGVRIAQNNTIKAHTNKNPLAGDPSSLSNGDEWISGTTTSMTPKVRLNGVTQPYLTFGANGSAATQTKRGVAGCATAASAGATCTTTVTWTVAFPDANYTCACSGTVITSGVPAYGGVTAKAAASCIVQTVAVTAAAAQFTNIECIATHD